MTTIVLIIIAAVFLLFSIIKSKKKTLKSLKIARNMLVNTLIDIIGVMAIVGLILAILPKELINKLLGSENVSVSTFFGAVIGTITIMPAFIAFPLSKTLYINGAHLVAIAAFLTTLTMVGFATMPIEIRHFGKKFTVIRNSLSFFMALLIAFCMGILL